MTVQINQETANIPSIALTDQGADIAAPSAGYVQFYTKSGLPYFRSHTAIVSPMENPMTTQDDVIVGGASGVPARLAKGADGYYLRVDPTTHHLVWAAVAAAGMATDPLWEAAGDLAVGTGAHTGGRLAKGAAYQLLRMPSDASTPNWAMAGVDWTPVVKQGSNTPTLGAYSAKSLRLGPLCFLWATIPLTTAAGQGGQSIIVEGMPFDPGLGAQCMGTFNGFDAGYIYYVGIVRWSSGSPSHLVFQTNASASDLGFYPGWTLANGDRIDFSLAFLV